MFFSSQIENLTLRTFGFASGNQKPILRLFGALEYLHALCWEVLFYTRNKILELPKQIINILWNLLKSNFVVVDNVQTFRLFFYSNY
jgi:hypothetical protein